MRVLVVTRGAPGCGKSTWVKENLLDNFTLCPDKIRTMCESPVFTKDGGKAVSQQNDSLVWDILFQILRRRMENGEFTVIDATCSKTTDMNRYKNLAKEYRYRLYLVDFTDVPMQTCIDRNKMRKEKEPEKFVPTDVIERMYSRFETQKVPSGITVIKPNEIDNVVTYNPHDFSSWKKIHHIGDIHGCYTALMEYLDSNGGMKDDELYIFTGDYVDRGIENKEVLEFLLGIYEKPNVILLEGNHERWLNLWAHDKDDEIKSQEFYGTTLKQIGDIDKREIRKLVRRMQQCTYYTYMASGSIYSVHVTHGGYSRPFECFLPLISTKQMVMGAGSYREAFDADTCFDRISREVCAEAYRVYQIHGHRNVDNSPIRVNDSCFNLEGKVEFGGHLRVVTLDKDGFQCHEIKNSIFRPFIKNEPEEKRDESSENLDGEIEALVSELRSNKFIQEKQFGNISSFNFTRDAFYKKKWDKSTTKARGLFIDTKRNCIQCRGYEKFFNLNERTETKLEQLSLNLQFPLCAYVKYNGFLCMVSYDAENDDFFVTSKSDPSGIYSQWAKEIFEETLERNLTKEERTELLAYLKENPVTFIFECIDPERDPHIIKYPHRKVVMLDIVYNEIHFKKADYSELSRIAELFKFEYKEKAYEIKDWQSFLKWKDEVLVENYLYNGEHIEGFVVEDATGFMFKMKLNYYNTWKRLRSVAAETLRCGAIKDTTCLYTPTMNYFYAWLKKHYGEDLPSDIISLRDLYEKDRRMFFSQTSQTEETKEELNGA